MDVEYLTFSPQDGKPGHCCVAQVFSGDTPVARIESMQDEDDATRYARLFAAAPELLAACQNIVTWLDRNVATNEVIAKSSNSKTMRKVFGREANRYKRLADDIRAAIAKATGQ
jgi:hypothetical protein